MFVKMRCYIPPTIAETSLRLPNIRAQDITSIGHGHSPPPLDGSDPHLEPSSTSDAPSRHPRTNRRRRRTPRTFLGIALEKLPD